MTAAYCRGIDLSLIPNAIAAVDGMDYRQLQRDKDFRRAVEAIIEDCHVSSGQIVC